MRQISVIPATKSMYGSSPLSNAAKKRVAAYARVSSDTDEQLNSYEAQVDHYTRVIKNNPDYIFIKVYTDEGITGTNTFKRDGFKQMVEDALAGNVDYIITKSVSRFARNTVDTLQTIRKLKDSGVEVFFEKEGINTFDSKGELLLTIMSSLAQEESRSLSENVKWGWRKRMADGKVCMPYNRFLGYERGEDGNPRVVEAEANVVKRIYRMCLDDCPPGVIARQLTSEGVPTPSGKTKWQAHVVESILTNEKYTGDALLQKVVTVDFLTKKCVKNTGQADQFFVKGSHPAIIDSEVFELVQDTLARRKGIGLHRNGHPFAAKIFCGQCGALYRRKTWHSVDQYRKVVWRCGDKYEKGKRCATPHIDEETIKELFVQAVNRLLGNKAGIIAACNEITAVLMDSTDIEAERAELVSQMELLTQERRSLVEASMRTLNPDFTRQDGELSAKFDELKRREAMLDSEFEERKVRALKIGGYCEQLLARDGIVTEFSKALWYGLLERVTVYAKDDIRFTFRDGSEVAGKA